MRLQPPDPATLTPAQRRVHDIIAAGPRGTVRGPLALWLHRPDLAEAAQALGRYCRYETTLTPRLSELAILTMASVWRAEYEWWVHKPIALAAGLEPDIVTALRDRQVPDFADAEGRTVHAVIHALAAERRLPQALHDEALAVLGPERLVDLIGLAGYYTLISMTLVAFDMPIPPGEIREMTDPE